MANASTEQRTVVVSRDVPARLVPDGTRITIHKNSFVNLRQALHSTRLQRRLQLQAGLYVPEIH